MRILTGVSEPLGLSIQGDRVNFALFSSHAKEVLLGLFSGEKLEKEIPMNRAGDVWHVAIEGLASGAEYAFRCDGKEVSDPYAKGMGHGMQAKVSLPKPFDWQGVQSPRLPLRDWVIYEMHVRGFTKHPSSGVSKPGTYLGAIEKIPYLKKLGINAVELMPIFEFDQTHCKKAVDTGKERINYWGYNPLHFFAPMRWYAAGDAVDEFKTFVRELHRNGIEVILDVVYNHTGEGKEKDYVVNFRGIDNSVYYMLDESGAYRDFTGCDNTVNANHPAVQRLILDSLRYWVEEMHVDGFRFDLASALTRDPQGEPMKMPPLIEKIGNDPVIRHAKLIAEAWDAAGLYQLGTFPKWGPWSEWNGRYRDEVRRFIKGRGSRAGLFAQVLCGTDSLYPSPLCSVNFITVHDGFTLRDLVTYESKYNQDNGEMNRDGSDQNDSWNCGVEGPTNDPNIIALRERQMRNFLLALFVSQGIPMLSMGDSYGHTRNGNNNPYVHDDELNWFLWDKIDPKILGFLSSLIAFRKQQPELRRSHFLTEADVDWHGSTPFQPDWNSQFIAWTLKGETPLYIAFNASDAAVTITLPETNRWRQVVHSAKDWLFENQGPLCSSIQLPPYSAFLAKKENSLV